MGKVNLENALLLWNGDDSEDGDPAFVVRPLGHPDYYRYDYQSGACYRAWQECALGPASDLLAMAMVELWRITTEYGVPAHLIDEAMQAVPEYRNAIVHSLEHLK